MRKYKEWRPTPLDLRGHPGHDGCMEDLMEWWVAPVIRTRDSGCLEESNFQTALSMLGGENDNVQVHRFGHWGPGWFEIILVRPDTEQADTIYEIEASLMDYPVLDDEDFSAREMEEMIETWERMSLRERIWACNERGICYLAARHDYVPTEMMPCDLGVN